MEAHRSCSTWATWLASTAPLKLTNTGEVTLFVQNLTMLTKSLAQPPEKFHGARDMEMLLRQRYVDLIYNEGVLERMLKRTKIIESIRKTLQQERFVEVEGPVLQGIAGGAAARPFITHHNALDMTLYLRIALELHLKRLMVGGVERVFEIGRVFRNEGIDSTHNPEFTMLELYQAYGNYESMMELTEAIVVNAVRAVGETLTLPWGDSSVDFTPPWPRRKYADLFAESRRLPDARCRGDPQGRGKTRNRRTGRRPPGRGHSGSFRGDGRASPAGSGLRHRLSGVDLPADEAEAERAGHCRAVLSFIFAAWN